MRLVPIPLTPEEERILIERSNTFWRKYGAKLDRLYVDGEPEDAFRLEYSVSTGGPEPIFSNDPSCTIWFTQEKIEEILGRQIV